MSDDFIRCYISDIKFEILKAIQRESGKFDEWELMRGSEFKYTKSYNYQGVFERDESLLEAIAKRSVIAETRQPGNVKQSIIWEKALNIADVITLLSLARARYYSTLPVEKSLGGTCSISWGVISREGAGNQDIVTIRNLGGFVSEALTFIESNPTWLTESGFIPGIYWYEQAQMNYFTAPTILVIGLYWVSLEILAKAYIDTKGWHLPRKRDRVKCFIDYRGYTGGTWAFLDKAIDDWYEIRNGVFHEGSEALPLGDISTLHQQIRDFASLVFVEMLQRQDALRIGEIAKRIRDY